MQQNDPIALFDRLRAIAQTGLAYSEDPFDRERYEELHDIALRLQAEQLGVGDAQLTAVFDLYGGYPTPKVEVRAGVFQDDKILLVRETSDGRWALPGGWCEPRVSPADNISKEVFEETGLKVRASKLATVRDESIHTYRPRRLEHVYKLLFLCDYISGELTHSIETTAAEYFPVDALPELSLGRTLPEDVLLLAEHRIQPSRATEFD